MVGLGWQDRPVRRCRGGQDRGDHGAHQQHRHEPRRLLGLRRCAVPLSARSGWKRMEYKTCLLTVLSVLLFAGVGERTREGNDLYHEMIEGGDFRFFYHICVFK